MKRIGNNSIFWITVAASIVSILGVMTTLVYWIDNRAHDRAVDSLSIKINEIIEEKSQTVSANIKYDLNSEVRNGVSELNREFAALSDEVGNKVEVNQQFLHALTLFTMDELDLAIPQFQLAWQYALDGGLTPGGYEPKIFLFPWLDALAYVGNPSKYDTSFEILSDAIDTNIMEPDGLFRFQLGYYHLRTNNLREAEVEFEKALTKFNGDDDSDYVSLTNWQLVIVNLAKREGDVDAAIAKAKEAVERDGTGLYTIDLVEDVLGWEKDPIMNQLMGLYRPLRENRCEFVKGLVGGNEFLLEYVFIENIPGCNSFPSTYSLAQ